MKLRLRAAAEHDLDDVFDYSVVRYGADAGEAYVRDLQSAMDRLLGYPKLGIETGLRPGLRSIGAREHRIFYRIERQRIVIVRVLHKTMDMTRHL